MANRRSFIRSSALAGGGLFLSFHVPAAKWLNSQVPADVFKPNAFLRITPDNQITVILSKVEMGQGIWTTLPMLIAEELDCDLSKVKVENSPPDAAYYHTYIPGLATVGSSSTTSEFDRYRQAGASARAMLIKAASNRSGLTTDQCHTENGVVIAGDKKYSFGELCMDASGLPVPDVKLKNPEEWKYIGKSQNRLDGPDKVTGKAAFGIDFNGPGMLTAVLLRPPVFNSKVKSLNSVNAKAVQGVKEVLKIENGVAVIADHYWAATKGREALKIEWDKPVELPMDSGKQKEYYRQLALSKGEIAQTKGEVSSALSRSSTVVEAEYWVPYLAHAPMETLNCAVKISHDICEIWTGTQLPTLDQISVAKELNLKPEQIKIYTPFLGGGFGRRGSFKSDFVMEAVRIAKASGKLIKLIWSREDDIKGGYYRPAYLHHVKVGLNTDGFPMAWQHRIVGEGVFRKSPFMPDPQAMDNSSVEGVKDSPYISTVPDHSVELHTTETSVPIIPWRSVGKSHTCFVMESMIDELATKANIDPVAYRRILLKSEPRYLSVLNVVAKRAGWGSPLPKGTGMGVAVYEGNGSYVAYVVVASMSNQRVKVSKVYCAIDCGLAVNPDGLKAQMEGSIVFGLSAALYGEISFKDGQVQQSNFHDYPMLRINEMPIVDIQIVQSHEKMGGGGEPGVPPIAPALVNAIFAATGKRVRDLPIRLKKIGS